MHDQLNTTPDTANETAPARAISKAELDTIELQVRDRLMQGDSEDQLRALTSTLLESAGQAPLSEGETKRTITLDVDGEQAEQAIVVDPNDFGTFVRSTTEMGIDGLVDEDVSHEAEEAEHQVEHDLGKQALKEVIDESVFESVETEDEPTDDAEDENEAVHEAAPSPVISELLNDPSWKNIDELNGQMKSRTKALISQLDELDRTLSRINYEGGRTATSAMQLNESLESLRRITSGNVDEDLAARTRSLRSRGEELLATVRGDAEASDDDRHKARLAEENVEEIATAGRVIHDEFEELRTLLGTYGKFANNIEELNRSTNGYEYTIGLLKSAVRAATEHTTMAYGRIGTIEARIEDAARLRRAE